MDGPGTHFYVEDTNPFRKSSNRPASGVTLNRQRSNSSPVSAMDNSRTEFRDSMMADQARRKSHRHPYRHQHRKTRVNPDIIDQLDDVSTMQYHHEGPYDAVYPERNRCSKRSPIDALKESNEETLRATPLYKIVDSVQRHRPLDGVAYYPPGVTDDEGHTYEYKEGDNMLAEMKGNFMRTPGVKFTDEDFKNDPFYHEDRQRPPKRMGSFRKAFAIRGRSRKNTA